MRLPLTSKIYVNALVHVKYLVIVRSSHNHYRFVFDWVLNDIHSVLFTVVIVWLCSGVVIHHLLMDYLLHMYCNWETLN